MSEPLKDSYDTDILSIRTSECLRPADLSGITTQVEVLSAFRSAEAENLRESKDVHTPIPYCRYEQTPFHVQGKWGPNRNSTFLFSFLLIQVEMELQQNGRITREKKEPIRRFQKSVYVTNRAERSIVSQINLPWKPLSVSVLTLLIHFDSLSS